VNYRSKGVGRAEAGRPGSGTRLRLDEPVNTVVGGSWSRIARLSSTWSFKVTRVWRVLTSNRSRSVRRIEDLNPDHRAPLSSARLPTPRGRGRDGTDSCKYKTNCRKRDPDSQPPAASAGRRRLSALSAQPPPSWLSDNCSSTAGLKFSVYLRIRLNWSQVSS
jgi:hypothetical protein